MTPKEPSIEQNLIDRLEGLILSIKNINPLMTEESISADLGYNEGYIAQCRSRKSVSEKFISRLETYLERLQNAISHNKTEEPENKYGGRERQMDLIIEAILRITDSNKELGEANKIQADSNRTLARSNEVLVAMLKEKFEENKRERKTVGSKEENGKKITTWNKEKTSRKAGHS